MKKEKETFDEEKENNLAEEIVLLNGKQSGSIREGPHSKPTTKPVNKSRICKNCRKTFQTKTELSNHMLTHKEDGGWTCNKCRKVFQTKSDLSTHMVKHKSNGDLTCKNCNNTFKTETELSTHMLTHTNDGDWTCDECAHQTNTLANLKRHLEASHHKSRHVPASPQSFSCNSCTRKFNSSTELEEHKRKSHKTFRPCKNLPGCPYENSCIFNHNTIDSSKFLCFACGNEFDTFSDLMFHRKMKHTMFRCIKFSENKCSFTAESCWYNHDSDKSEEQSSSQQEGFWDPPPAPNHPSVFRDVPVNLAPPSPQPTQATWLKMVTMMENLNQMMKNIKETNQFLSS